MKYFSTRNTNSERLTASQCILKGISEDGGLFIPEFIPEIDFSLGDILNLSYQELAYKVLKLFLTDFTEEELKYCINSAYDNKFDVETIAPLIKVGENNYFLELFHGKTLAFKDMALSILPYFMTISARKNNIKDKIVILTATSGDTGKAALEGFADVEGTEIFVFYPKDGVSVVQELQMVTQKGNNVNVAGITGNFDDAQSKVKEIFTDEDFKKFLKTKGIMLSSANSINIGRLLPQVVYYFYAYAQLVNLGDINNGDEINFTVPTGNFGNILAAYYAKEMGLPIKNLVCATNENKVLYDYFESGVYDKNREFTVTNSPSMDILVSSNFERFLFYNLDDKKNMGEIMKKLSEDGTYSVKFESCMKSMWASEEETVDAINEVFKMGYTMDTHTAVAYKSYSKLHINPEVRNIIVSTASPYKFSKSVYNAIADEKIEEENYELLQALSKITNTKIPNQISGLFSDEVRFDDVIDTEDMKDYVLGKL